VRVETCGGVAASKSIQVSFEGEAHIEITERKQKKTEKNTKREENKERRKQREKKTKREKTEREKTKHSEFNHRMLEALKEAHRALYTRSDRTVSSGVASLGNLSG